jgi:uncharacterized protein
MEVNYFKKIKVRWLLLWSITSFIVTALIGALNDSYSIVNPEIFSEIAVDIIYLTSFIWILISFNKYDVSLKRILVCNHKAKIPWGYYIFLTLLLMILSIGIELCIFYVFSLFHSNFINDLLSNNKNTNTSFSSYQLLSTIIIAPVVEECVFRGYLFNKWGETLGVKKSILVTSFIFGICHIVSGGFFAQFFFGILCCIVYIKTKSLIVPIVLHIVNNTVTTLGYHLTMLLPNETGNEKIDTVTIANQLKFLGEIGLVLVVLILPVSLFLLIKLYKQSNKQPPYLANNS